MKYIDTILPQDIVRQLMVMSKQTGEVGKLSHFDILGKIDETLEKATRVASRKDPYDPTRPMYDSEVWLEILEFFHLFQVRTVETMQRQKNTVDLPEKLERFTQFCQGRIRYVLQREGMNVSIRRITSRLDLEIGDIKMLCRMSLDVHKSNSKRQQSMCHIMQVDLMHLIEESNYVLGTGAALHTRLNPAT